MKRNLALLLALSASIFANADTLSISDCYKMARENYPMIRQFDLIKEAKKYDIENATRGYLPQFSISANAMYLSDTPDIMGTSILPKDQYRAQIGVNQVLWDGGDISAKKRLTQAQAKAELENNTVLLYELNDRVNRLFFGILLQEESLQQNQTYRKDIKDVIASVEGMIANGVANDYDLNLLKVELLKAEQTQAEIKSSKQAYLKMLSFLINKPLDENTQLEYPQKIEELKKSIMRPELDYYMAQEEALQARTDTVDAGLMPKISLFGYGGYGKSSFASLNDEKLYGVGGISFSWSFGNFYTEQNEKMKISANRSMVRAQADAFIFNTRLKMIQEDGEIKKMSVLINKDTEIVALRKSIKMHALSKMKNGTVSTTDFIRELNALEIAKQTQILHSIEKLSREYNYKYLTNN